MSALTPDQRESAAMIRSDKGVHPTQEAPFFFCSARHTLTARATAPATLWEPRADATLAEAISGRLEELREQGAPRPCVAGALPFDPGQCRAALWLVSELQRAEGRPENRLQAQARGLLATAPGYGIRMVPSPEAYVQAVERALQRIRAGALSKVVLARCLEVALERPLARADLMRELVAQNGNGFAFALTLPPRDGEARSLLGVSPELLIAKRGAQVQTNPLAGSRPRGRDRSEDESMVKSLLASKKDHYEHALVIEAVAEALRPFCRRLDVPRKPSLASTPTMWHLSTALRGELHDPHCSSLTLALALHPTPAVCGHPQAAARDALAELEGFDRDLYAGAVGYADQNGDGEWVVTLRCAELTSRRVRLYAGAGVVEGSDPWAELDETAAKFGTVLRALGIGLPRVYAC